MSRDVSSRGSSAFFGSVFSFGSVLAAAVALAACGPSADASPDALASSAPQAEAPAGALQAGQAGVLGTIEATVDGEALRWHVVTGSVRGEPYSSALWFQTPDGDLVASFGGYDTADLPFDSFEMDPARGLSLGDYVGSAITLLLMPESGAEPFVTTLSDDAPGLSYAPVATAQDITTTLFGRSGTLRVTRLEIDGERLSAEGTFEGSLATMGGEGSVQITNGRFVVEGVPSRDSLTGGG